VGWLRSIAYVTPSSSRYRQPWSSIQGPRGCLPARGGFTKCSIRSDRRRHRTIQKIDSPLMEGIECDRVTFGYPSGQLVLSDVSFRLKGAEKVALVGRSGRKVDAVPSLCANRRPRCRPHPHRRTAASRVHPQNAAAERLLMCPKQPQLFSGTIRQNLLYANAEATEGEMERVIEASATLAASQSTTSWLETALARMRWDLGRREAAAGNRSRSTRQPSVLILDESTSALDLPTSTRSSRRSQPLETTWR